jgi:DNA-binding response OmpR family regulator
MLFRDFIAAWRFFSSSPWVIGTGLFSVGISFCELFNRIRVTAMDDPSDGDGKKVEIVMITSDTEATSLLRESLEERGYHVTVFPDGARLNAAPGQLMPDLIIYDGKTGGEGYELITRMKSDELIRTIPTLVLSRASDMHDLIKILESSADDFIAPPYAVPDHLSLIDGLISGEARRHHHGETVKQFTIRHDDQVYTVATTSRNLLEYLLSAFEILVSKSAELSRVSKDLEEVSGSVEILEQKISGQARDLETLKSDIDEKKAKIIVFSMEHDKLSGSLKQKTDEIQGLKKEYEDIKRQNEGLLKVIEEEKVRNSLLEERLNESMLELGQQKSSLIAERNRLLGAEEEISALKREKTRSEKELNGAIGSLNDTIVKQDSEIAELRSGIDSHASLKDSLEQEISALKLEKSQSETQLNDVIANLNNTVTKQDSEIAELRSGIDSHASLKDSLEQEISALKLEKSQSETQLNDVIANLNNTVTKQDSEIAELRSGVDSHASLKDSLEQEISALKLEKSQSETQLNDVIANLNNTITAQEAEISRLKGIGETETDQRISAENQITRLRRDLEQSQDASRSEIEGLGCKVAELQALLNTSAETLDTERGLRRTSENNVTALVLELRDLKIKTRITNKEEGGAGPDQASIKSDPGGEAANAANQGPSIGSDLHFTPLSESHTHQDTGALAAGDTGLFGIPTTGERSVTDKDTVQADQGKERHLVQQPLLVQDEEPGHPETRSLVIQEPAQLPVITAGQGSSREITPPGDNSKDLKESVQGTAGGPDILENPEGTGNALQYIHPSVGSREKSAGGVTGGEILFTGKDWLDLLKWAHHSDALSEAQRGRIIRMGRLIQKDRKLTKSQQQQVSEILALVQTLGYRPGE